MSTRAWSRPVALTITVALVIGKEGFNAFFAQIGGSVATIAGANGYIGQFKATATLAVSIVSITTLNVADNQLSTTAMIGKVRKGFHGQDGPTNVTLVGNPTIVRSKLGKVTNERFDHELVAPNNHDIAAGNQNLVALAAKLVPLQSQIDCLVGYMKVLGKEFIFQYSIFGFELLANGFLLVTIAAKVRARISDAKGAFPDNLASMQRDIL